MQDRQMHNRNRNSEFLGSPVVSIWLFHCWGPGSSPGLGSHKLGSAPTTTPPNNFLMVVQELRRLSFCAENSALFVTHHSRFFLQYTTDKKNTISLTNKPPIITFFHDINNISISEFQFIIILWYIAIQCLVAKSVNSKKKDQ